MTATILSYRLNNMNCDDSLPGLEKYQALTAYFGYINNVQPCHSLHQPLMMGRQPPKYSEFHFKKANGRFKLATLWESWKPAHARCTE